jgi:NADH dehydrogenase
MALTVIGGSSFVGRYLIKALAGSYKEVRLGDMYPYRESVYRMQEELGDKITKHPLSYPTNLRLALDGTENLVIVTHDYFKYAHSKNFYLARAVQWAKEYGIKNITWVGPKELDHLVSTEVEESVKTEESVRAAFPDLKILRTDLIFGQNCNSLLFQKTLEDLHARRSIVTGNNGHTVFAPVHEDEVLATFKALKAGEKVSLAGPEDLRWEEIVKVLANHVGTAAPSHLGFGNALASFVAQCEVLGDAFYPSHYQQLYRLVDKASNISPTARGTKKLSDFYAPGKFQGVQPLNWHRVILD